MSWRLRPRPVNRFGHCPTLCSAQIAFA
jgi:hypothetical protein